MVVLDDDGLAATRERDHLAAVGPLERFRVEDRRRAEGDLAAVDAEDPVGLVGVVDVVGRDQDRAPRLLQVGEDAPDPAGRSAVEPAERLVQEQAPAPRGPGPAR